MIFGVIFSKCKVYYDINIIYLRIQLKINDFLFFSTEKQTNMTFNSIIFTKRHLK